MLWLRFVEQCNGICWAEVQATIVVNKLYESRADVGEKHTEFEDWSASANNIAINAESGV